MMVKAIKMILALIVLVCVISLSDQDCHTLYQYSDWYRGIECENITINHGLFSTSYYSEFRRLEVLVITESNFSVFSYDLTQKLPALKKITVSQSGVKIIDYLRKRSTPPYLISINLSHNEISKLSNNIFSSVPTLNDLNVSHNRIEIIEPLFFNSSIETLDLSYNKIKVFPIAALDTKLLTINLSYNELTEISNNQFDTFQNLINVYMSHNNIEIIEISTTNSIETLDLSHNNIKDITSILKYFLKLHKLHLNNNLISEIPRQGFDSLQFLNELDLGGNKLHEMNFQILLGNNKFLHHLDLNNNSLNITNLNVLNTNSISTLMLSKNIFNITTIKVFKELTDLDVSMTNSSIISIDTFTNNILLKYLNLSYNNIEVLHTGTFAKLLHLSRLDLAGNKLQALPSGLFHQNPLFHLSVANNRLVTFNMDSLHHYRRPDFIDLDDNLWSCNTLTKIIHHLEDISELKSVSKGNHYSEPNIKGNLCTLNSTESETNVTIQEVLIQNLDVMRDIHDYLEDQELINKMMIKILASPKNNSLRNNVAIENQTLPVLTTNIDKIGNAPFVNKNENYVFVKSSILTWLLCIQTLFMFLITSIIIYYLKCRRASVRSNGTLLHDMDESL
ncbi:leucine-rich repeat-containing protein 15-like [Onthophagus taurus]|uniref:leucine-rich repeat-containing protein 15-like n=1 Tax=Onthophagus taurus TaxID=166361 RepID=UPI0039BE0D12